MKRIVSLILALPMPMASFLNTGVPVVNSPVGWSCLSASPPPNWKKSRPLPPKSAATARCWWLSASAAPIWVPGLPMT